MRVSNIHSAKGNPVVNQFIIEDTYIKYAKNPEDNFKEYSGTMFQSYDSNIAFDAGNKIFLDKRYWKYSSTTSKYRSIFLGESTKETQRKIDSGKYILTNLN